MALDDLDATLHRLREAADAIGSNLLELDSDANRKLLENATLSGTSAARWQDASSVLVTMWSLLTRLTALLDEASELRGTRSRIAADQEARLEALLTGPSLELERAEIPLPARTATGGRESTTRCTPDELVTAISEAFDRAKAVIFGIGAAWDTLIPRLRAAQATVATAIDDAQSLGEDTDLEVKRLEARVDELADAVVMDPLSADMASIDALEAEAADLRAALGAAAQLRDATTEQIAAAGRLMEDLRHESTEAIDAHREVTEKIVSPHVTAPSPVARGVRDELDRVAALADAGKWRTAQHALELWTTRATELLQAAKECTAQNRAPIEERNELRGRLDAYRAMAHGRGLIEDPEASARYDEAFDVLYTAPTDLAEAAALVRRYQEALHRDPIDPRGRM